MNSKHQFIRRRGSAGRLYYKRRYPTDVANYIGMTHYDKSLGTSSFAEADKPAAQHAMDFVRIVEQARADMTAEQARSESIKRLQADEIRADFLEIKVGEWMQSAVVDKDDSVVQRFDSAGKARESALAFAITNDIPESLRESFVSIAMAEYLHAIPRETVTISKPGRPFLTSRPSAQPVQEVTLLTAFGEWKRRSGLRSARIRDGEIAVRDFLAVNGLDDIAIDRISYEQVTEYFDALCSKPKMTGISSEVYIRASPDLLSWVAENLDEYDRISVSSVGKVGTALSAKVTDQKKRGRVKMNPFSGNVPRQSKTDRRRARRWSFTEEQARAVLHAPIWTGYGSARKNPGDRITEDAYYWILPVLAWTGCRFSEIAKLHVDNIRAGDIPHIDLTEIHPAQSLKTEAAERRIPIHHELIEAGFLDFVTRQKRQTNADWVFPEVMDHNYGDRENPNPEALKAMQNAAHRITKYYNQHIIHGVCGLPPKLTVHSFRHSYKTALRQLGYADGSEIWNPLMGHEGGGAGFGYGEYPLEPLNDVVQKLVIPGASLAHLRR